MMSCYCLLNDEFKRISVRSSKRDYLKATEKDYALRLIHNVRAPYSVIDGAKTDMYTSITRAAIHIWYRWKEQILGYNSSY